MNDYIIDFTELDKERPVGVSGLMRVKNDGKFVAASIDSCIEALDELVIVYDDSEDNTEDEIRRKQQDYPNKIRIFHYEPPIYSHNLNDDDFDRVMALDSNSPHLLANYYNWTMSKASYRYAFKIDADQIYFSDKLKTICDLYRSEKKVRFSIGELLSYYYFEFIRRVFIHTPGSWHSLMSRIFYNACLAQKVQCFLFKKINNDKIIASFSGINVFYDNCCLIPLGKFNDGIQPPVNGSGDHIFFRPNSRDRYVPWPQKIYHRIIEVMEPSEKICFGGGFLWLHMNPMREDLYEKNLEKYQGHTLDASIFLESNFFDVCLKNNLKITKDLQFFFFHSLLADKSLIKERIMKIVNYFDDPSFNYIKKS